MDFLGDGYSFDDIIDEAQEAGYEGIELGRKFPRDPVVLKEALAKRKLVLTSAWCTTMFACKELRDEYFGLLKEKAAFLKEMGCKYIIVAEGTNSTFCDPRNRGPEACATQEERVKKSVRKLDDGEWKLFADGMNEAGEFANGIGMTLVYHVHTGTVMESHEETQKLCDMTDPDKVFILADTGHLTYCGVDVPKFLRTFKDRIKYVHLKDVRPDVLRIVREYGMDFLSAVQVGVFTVPGDGCVDFKEVFGILAENGYQGWMLVEAEQYFKTPNALEFAKMAREYVRGIAGV
jgi:inosose dehydratase